MPQAARPPSAGTALKTLQESVRASLVAARMPTNRNEAYRFTNLATLTQARRKQQHRALPPSPPLQRACGWHLSFAAAGPGRARSWAEFAPGVWRRQGNLEAASGRAAPDVSHLNLKDAENR